MPKKYIKEEWAEQPVEPKEVEQVEESTEDEVE